VGLWVHGGFLQMSGQKMSKSARNIRRVSELADQGIDPLAFRLLCFGTRYRSEMDFSWDSLEAADRALTRLRQRVAGWEAFEVDGSGAEARELDRRFRERVGDDLDLPGALVIMNEAVSAAIPDGDKRVLLASWDGVLGLDLERLAREGFEVPPEVQALVEERDAARRDGDFARSDAIRDRVTAMGWEVMDTADGTRVRPRATR
jgi:cysteinyl-tRNA synthetase